MPITLTGMASGLDTDSIISQLMAIEQNKVTAVQMKQVSVQAHKDDLDSIRTALNNVKTAAAALSDTSLWKPTQTHRLVGHDQARRHRHRRRRHRRPLDPDQPPGLLGSARRGLHAADG